ncbi:MAG: class I SAM-dependent methyltransferase [Ktedonobacterales bacterium]
MPDTSPQPPATPYDAIAEWYDGYLRERPLYRETLLPAVLNLVGDVQGLTLCDLACGQGFVTRELAQRGAHLVGADISERLLALARRYEDETPLGIRYLHDDAQTGAHLPDASFDGVACIMALMPIADIAATFQTVYRLLKPGGWFVFAITHPCYQTSRSRWTTWNDGSPAREVSAYFTEGYWQSENTSGVRGQVGEYHRTLGAYLNTLIAAGLRIERISEPQAMGDNEPGNREVPTLLLVRARKG